MSLPRRGQPAHERTADQRERDRLERERRRASDPPGEVPPPAEAPSPLPPEPSEAAIEIDTAPRTRPSLVPPPRRGGGAQTGRRRTRARRVAALLALLVVAVVLWFLLSLFEPFKGSGHGRVVVDIPRGASARQIGDLLARDHVVASGFFFNLRAALEGKRGELKAGRFTLRLDMSYGAALSALTHQRPALAIRVTIPEGSSRVEVATLARSDGIRGDYLQASRRSSLLAPARYGAPRGTPSLEGFLFPSTFELPPGSTAGQLVAAQLAAFARRFPSVDLRYARRRHLTPYDVLIIGSMIEREAALASERPLIAAVIYNRLHDQMPLGIDATIRYALGDWSQPLTAAQLAIRSPYNTRLYRGLPPTPIGSPGLASIEAAAHPARVRYLYYVIKPGTCGQDAFSSTYAQFQRDVAAYDRARAANGGRSPTRCPGR